MKSIGLLFLTACFGLSDSTGKLQTPQPQRTVKVQPPSEQIAVKPKLSFSQRMALAIEESQDFVVSGDDMLGEGGWDSEPRMPDLEVNCMIWLQWVLARVYARPSMPLAEMMDVVRYYEGGVSFGARKHYIDRWVTLEPGPLRKHNSKQCRPDKQQSFHLRFDLLKKHWGYACSMYKEQQHTIAVDYFSISAFEDCVPQLSDGYYVVFPVAGKRYIRYHSVAGTMGLVHSMILQRNGQESVLWHASIDYQEVVSEKPTAFAKRMKGIITGFAIFDLDPNWLPFRSTLSSEIKTIQSCEKKLPQRPSFQQ